MPWSIKTGMPGCSGFAVVKQSDGKVVGCHPTKAKAQAQLAALNINVKAADVDGEGRAWNGDAAMAACSSASDYRSVCAGHTDGDPSLRSTWKLPHHDRPGAAANPDGVRAARARFGSTQGLTNREEARRHLFVTHTLPSDSEASALPTENLFRAIYPGVEMREAADGQPVLAGHFAKFNEWTEIDSLFEGRFMERIAPGAFEDSFQQAPPKILFQHGRDPDLGDKVLGSPVTVREDEVGAYYEVPLFPSVPPLIVDGLRAGAYGASFRFSVLEDEVVRKPQRSETNPEGLPERTITKTRTSEAGPVTFPAYAGATAGIRSLTDEFRPYDFNSELVVMVREHPTDLAVLIQRALPKATEDKPLEDKPPAPQRFRTREEYLEWVSKS